MTNPIANIILNSEKLKAVREGRREEGSGWGTCVYLWRIHVDIWQNQYNIVKLKNKIKIKKKSSAGILGTNTILSDCYSFILQLEIMKCDFFSFIVLSQYWFAYSVSLVITYKFEHCFSCFCKKWNLNLDRDCFESVNIIALNSMDIVTILIIPIHQHRITFHFWLYFI